MEKSQYIPDTDPPPPPPPPSYSPSSDSTLVPAFKIGPHWTSPIVRPSSLRALLPELQAHSEIVGYIMGRGYPLTSRRPSWSEADWAASEAWTFERRLAGKRERGTGEGPEAEIAGTVWALTGAGGSEEWVREELFALPSDIESLPPPSHMTTSASLPEYELSARSTSRTVRCPRCLSAFEVVFANAEGTGYIQPGFLAACTSCGLRFGRDELCAARFVRELSKWRRSGGADGFRYFIESVPDQPGTRKRLAALFRDALDRQYPAVDYRELGEQIGWSMAIVEVALRDATRVEAVIRVELQEIATGLLEAFAHPPPLPVDLIQTNRGLLLTLHAITALEWSDADLMTAVSRYHSYLDLVRAHGHPSRLVPTLDIRLAWWAHAREGRDGTYRRDMLRLLGFVPVPAELPPPEEYDAACKATAKAWKQRFSTPYQPTRVHTRPPIRPTSILSALRRRSRSRSSSPSTSPSPSRSPSPSSGEPPCASAPDEFPPRPLTQNPADSLNLRGEPRFLARREKEVERRWVERMKSMKGGI